MQVNVQRLEGSKVVLEVEIDAEEVEKSLDRAYRKLVSQTNIPGFRRGRAPRAILERHVGQDRLRAEALDELLPSSYAGAVEEATLEPLDRPELEVTDFEPGQPLKFQATVHVRPDVKLGDYRSAREGFTPEEATVTDAEVDEHTTRMRERMARLVPAAEQVARPGRFAVVDSQASVEGAPAPMDKVEGQTLELGSDDVFPEVTEALDGAVPGDTRTATIKFDADHPNEDLRDKEVTVTLELKEVKEKSLPELDDEFASQVGSFTTVQELREDLKNRLLRLSESAAERKYEEQVIGAVVDAAEVEIPDVLVDRYFAALSQDFDSELQNRGLNRAIYFETSGETPEQFDASLRERAERTARTDLVLEEISRVEGIKPEPEDVDRELSRYSRVYNKPVAEIRNALQASDRFGNILDTITRKKTIALLAQGSADAWHKPGPGGEESKEEPETPEVSRETEEGQSG